MGQFFLKKKMLPFLINSNLTKKIAFFFPSIKIQILDQLSNGTFKIKNPNPISLNNCTHLIELKKDRTIKKIIKPAKHQ